MTDNEPLLGTAEAAITLADQHDRIVTAGSYEYCRKWLSRRKDWARFDIRYVKDGKLWRAASFILD